MNAFEKMLGGVGHSISNDVSAVQRLLGINKPSQPQQAPMSLDRASHAWEGDDLTQPAQFNRVLGNLELASSAEKWGYTPKLRAIAAATEPVVMSSDQAPFKGVRGEYIPDTNQTQFYGHSASGYAPLHEFLHAAYNQEPAQQQQNFLQLAQSNANPQEQARINASIRQPIYQNKNQNAGFPSLPKQLATEVHSYLPAYMGPRTSPQIKNYYNQFYDANGKY